MATITKRDLVNEISDSTGITNEKAVEALECFFNRVGSALSTGEKVVIREFGTFEGRIKKEKLAHNPKNPEQKVIIPTQAVVRFKPGKTLKQKVAVSLPILINK